MLRQIFFELHKQHNSQILFKYNQLYHSIIIKLFHKKTF